MLDTFIDDNPQSNGVKKGRQREGIALDRMASSKLSRRFNAQCSIAGMHSLRNGIAQAGEQLVTETYLLHNARLPLREGDVATRLVGDELNFDLATLASALLVVVVVVVCYTRAGALDTTRLGAAVADGMAIVKVVGRRLVVLVGDVGHGFLRAIRRGYHEKGKKKSGGDAVLSVVPTTYTESGLERREPLSVVGSWVKLLLVVACCSRQAVAAF